MITYAITKNTMTGEISFGFLCVGKTDEAVEEAARTVEADGGEILHHGEEHEFERLLLDLQKTLQGANPRAWHHSQCAPACQA